MKRELFFYQRHLKKFIERHQLIRFKRVYVAVSGGKDSMTLLYFFHLLKDELSIDLHAIHINHGTRNECQMEEDGVKKFCVDLGVPLTVKRFHLNKDQKNFESVARKIRYKAFREIVPSDAHLATAHTIDDSFEWHLLSMFKSAELKSSIGIPLYRGNLIRPFHSFTRRMVERSVRFASIPYFEDSSNQNLSYERNYLRNVVIPKIKKRFPSYLKQYVLRANRLALLFCEKREQSIYQIREHNYGTVIFRSDFGLDFRPAYGTILNAIKRWSMSDRGMIGKELEKLFAAILLKREGPMSFSGGVKIFIDGASLLVTNEKELTFFAKKDQELARNINNSQIPSFSPFPNWHFSKISSTTRKRTHHLWPLTVEVARENGISLLSEMRLLELVSRGDLKRGDWS